MTKKKVAPKIKKKTTKKTAKPKAKHQKSAQIARTTRTAKKRELFLEILASTCNVSQASRISGYARRTAYEYREANEAFAKQWDEAIDIGIDALEGEARRRAHRGTRKPVFHKGSVCGCVQEYSDTLMIFLLKAHRPAKYRERVDHKVELNSGSMLEMIVKVQSDRNNGSPAKHSD